MSLRYVTILTLAAGPLVLGAQTVADLPPLPGKGLAQHPFLCCGEWQRRSTSNQTIYIVREGKVLGSYTNPLKGELGDGSMLENGNILFSRQPGAADEAGLQR